MPEPIKEQHPSFGLVGFSRASVGGSRRARLFGSAIEKHYNVVLLSIHRASETHDLSHNSQFPEEQLIEVEMSEAQFASLLTNMNAGSGVPCTIRYIKAEGNIEPPPIVDPETTKVRKGFEEDIKDLAQKFQKMALRAKEILKTAKSTREEREELLSIINSASIDLNSNFGFVIEQFAEATEKVVTEAKAEVDAFVSNAARITGMEKIKELSNFSTKAIAEDPKH